MSKAARSERERAIVRGLEFMHRTSREPENFRLYGFDYLFCFDSIASTAREARVGRLARKMGRECARRWRREHPSVPADATARDIYSLTMGSYSADKLGVVDRSLAPQIREAAARFGGRDYYGFDPLTEPPPDDVPDACACGAVNPRGRKTCRECRKKLTMLGRYGVWLDALIDTYFADCYGVTLGAPYATVVGWRPAMLPYVGYEGGENPDFYWTAYAVTHVVYTLNEYGVYRLPPRRLAEEFEFLKGSMKDVVALEDAETVGEYLDTLKAFGLTDRHPLIRDGIDFVLAHQNPDGSWGDTEADDIYQRYHPTFTAVLGLFDRNLRGRSPRLKLIRGA